jgi:hypothetical protein
MTVNLNSTTLLIELLHLNSDKYRLVVTRAREGLQAHTHLRKSSQCLYCQLMTDLARFSILRMVDSCNS